MKAIILAAGEGVRMRPLTLTTPKPLLKIGALTLMDRVAQNLPDEVDELIIVVDYLKEKIIAHCGADFFGRKVFYVDQPANTKGTFAAVKCCQHLLKNGERFFVIFADDLIDSQCLKKCLQHERAIITAAVGDSSRFGVVQLDGQGNLISIFEKPEKPISNLALTNAVFLDTNIFNYQPPLQKGEEYLSLAIEKMAKDFPIKVISTDFWFPVAFPQDLIAGETYLSDRGS